MSENGLVEAYRFELQGGSARITYDAGTRELRYVGPSRPPLDDVVDVTETVSPLATPIGRLLTVTLRNTPDRVVSTVSVLLPRVNLETGDAGMGKGPVASPAAFETVAVWTDSLSSRGGPDLVSGVVHRYDSVEMEGTAQAPHVFTAVQTGRLPGPRLLVVEGGCTFDSSGYEVSLVRHEPQGTVAEDLLLDLVVNPPGSDEIVLPVVSTYPVSYEEESRVWFDTVTILPDGPSVRVDHIS
jgi:hypothetical protein